MRKTFTFMAVMIAAELFLITAAAEATEKKVVTITDYNIHDKKYKQKAFSQFSKDNPDIEVKYTSQVGAVYDQTIALAIKVGEEPDLYIPAGNIPRFNELVEQKRILAIDDIAPDKAVFQAWKAKFPEVMLRAAMYKEKMWVWPLSGNTSNARPLFVNMKLFKEAGIAAMPKNWKEFRDDAAKVTSAGAGQYFGAAIGAKFGWVVDMYVKQSTAESEGSFNGWIDYHTGRSVYTDDAFKRSFDLWLAVKKDGSIFPGDTSMDDEGAKSAFATDRTSMVVGGPWNPGGFISYNPDIDFDMRLFPTSDGGPVKGYAAAPDPLAASGLPWGYYLSAKTKHPDAVWRVIQFMTSAEYQIGWVKAGGGVSVFPEYNKTEYYGHPAIAKMAQMYLVWDKIKPRTNHDATYGPYVPAIHPDDREIMQGIWAGAEKWEAMVEYEKKANDGIDEAIRKAQAAGIKVSRSDLIFPDWDPLENYPPPKKK